MDQFDLKILEDMVRRIVREELQSALTPPSDERAVDLREMGRILGFGPDKVRVLAKEGKIPGEKFGGSWRFYPSAVRAEISKPKPYDPWAQPARSHARRRIS